MKIFEFHICFATLMHAIIFAIFLNAESVAGEKFYLNDGDRTISVSYDVDVLVLGGTTSAVAAAVESAKNGANTMLVTENNYLGEDLTATLRLWKQSKEFDDPLLNNLYGDPWSGSSEVVVDTLLESEKRIDFTYSVVEPLNEKHQENKTKSRLSDGIIGSIKTDSLQTDGPMTIFADLGTAKEVGSLVFVAFHRTSLSTIDRVTIEASDDAKHWKTIGTAKRFPGVKPKMDEPDYYNLRLDRRLRARYWKIRVEHTKSSRAVFASELFFFSDPRSVENLTARKKDAPVSPPRPLHVKRQLDQALLDADVEFLFGSFVTGRIIRPNGENSGVLISNRAGRQAIVAKQVVDLRNHANTALKKIAADSSKTATVEYVVIGGEAVDIDLKQHPLFQGAICETIRDEYYGPVSMTDGTIVPYKIFRFLFDIDRDFVLSAFSGDIAKYGRLFSTVRLASYHPGQQFTADRISLLEPGKPLFNFDENLFETDRQMGAKAAAAAKAMEQPVLSSLRAESGTQLDRIDKKVVGRVEELSEGIRPYGPQVGKVHLPGASYAVVGEYDVVVVGGGTTGAPAGIAASRAGAKTLVVELQSSLGGVGTLGSITVYYHGNKVGFTTQVLDNAHRWLPNHKSHWWATELTKAGGEVWYGVLGAGAVVDPDLTGGRKRVKGVLLATPFGPKIVLAKVVIDTTGSGDIARAAGSEMDFTTTDEITVQGAGLSPLGLGNYRMNNDYTYIDDTDPIDVTHVYVFNKQKYPSAFDQGKVVGTRERRRIVGDFVLTPLDQMNNRTYEDSIAQSRSDFDSHGYTTSPFLYLYHPVRKGFFLTYYPYRASLPRKLDGILVGALATSGHRDAIPLIRMQADLQNQGYALGYIAAEAAKEFVDKPVELRKIDIRKVQKHLVEIGNLPESVLTDTDNYESSKSGLAEAVRKLPEDAKQALLIMWHPEDSLPLLRTAYHETNDLEAKLIYARTLALLDDATGEKTLLERVEKHDGWDKGWNFKGMSHFGTSSSPLDKDIMLLGRLKSKAALPIIIQKLEELEPEADFSHHRACYLALEWIGDPSGREALASHLNKPGMTGHFHPDIEAAVRADKSDANVNNAEKGRRDSLKEIGAARALYRLGDHHGIGKRILENYSKDLRGHFARHAAEELKRGTTN